MSLTGVLAISRPSLYVEALFCTPILADQIIYLYCLLQRYKRSPGAVIAAGQNASPCKQAKLNLSSQTQQSNSDTVPVQLLDLHTELLAREIQLLDIARSRINNRGTDIVQCTKPPVAQLTKIPMPAMPVTTMNAADAQDMHTAMPVGCQPATEVSEFDQLHKTVSPQQSLQVTRGDAADHGTPPGVVMSQPQAGTSACAPITPIRSQAEVAADSPTLYLTPTDAAVELFEDALGSIHGEAWYTPPESSAPTGHEAPCQQYTTPSAMSMPDGSAFDDMLHFGLLQTVEISPDEWLIGHD